MSKMREKTKATLLTLVFLISAIAVIVPTITIANASTELYVGPGQAYTTIQAAINAALPDETILVYPGTYTENLVVPAGKDRLTIQSLDGSAVDGTADTILSPASGTAIDVNSPVTIKGFYILQSDIGTAINVVKSGGVSGTSENPAVIQGNKIESPSGSRGDGIKWSDYVCEYWKIKDNILINRKLAIYLNRASHLLISGNTLTGYKEGIGMNWSGEPAHDLTIVNNNFLGTDYPFTPQELLEKAAIMLGQISYNVEISGNTITGSPNGIRIPAKVGATPNLANVHINNNNIYGNTHYGITNDVSVAVDATLNWWGDISGPYHSTNADGLGKPVSNKVLYNPWLDGTYDVGDPWTDVWIDEELNGKFDLGEPCFTAIQPAITAASPGDTINVAAGTYDEMLTINKGLTLLGANAGVHPAVGMHPTETVGIRDPESVIVHSWYAFYLQADDITIDGFKFTGEIGGAGQIIRTYHDANNFHLTNCIFDISRNAVSSGWVLFGDGSHNDLLIDFNIFMGEGDASIYLGGTHPSYERVLIAYNKFNGLDDSIFLATNTPLVDCIIEGNDFDGTINEVPGVGFGTINIGKGGNIIIRNNWFHDILYTGFQVGIIGGSVTGNTFERIYPYAEYGGDAFQLWGGQYTTTVSTDVLIEHNTITYNDVSTAYPTHGIRLRAPEGGLGIDGSTIHIHDNNFIDGGKRPDAFAIRHQGNPETYVDATLNFWGTPEESVIQGMVSGLVNYDPWFGKLPKVEETDPGPDTVEALGEADTIVEKTGEGTPTVSVAEFTENPEEGFSNEAGKYYDVKIDDDTGVDSLTLKFYYTDTDLGGRDESTLRMRWYDSEASAWVPCSHQTLHTVSDVSGYSGYIEVYVAATGTTPSLSDLTGTPFGSEGEWPVASEAGCGLSVSGDVIVEAAEDMTHVYASMGETAEITVELDLAGYHGDIYFTLYTKVDGGLAYVKEIKTVYGVELKGSRTASWVVDQSPGTYVIWINIDLMEKVQLTGLDEALHIGPIEVLIS